MINPSSDNDSFQQENQQNNFNQTHQNFQSYFCDLPVSKNMIESRSVEKNSSNSRILKGNKIVVVSNVNIVIKNKNGSRRDKNIQQFTNLNQNDQFLRSLGMSDLETQTSSLNITPKQKINKIAEKIFRKGLQQYVKPKQIPININQSQQQYNVYYVGSQKNIMSTPRQAQMINQEKNQPQQKQFLQNNQQQIKNSDRLQQLPSNHQKNMVHFKTMKRESSHPDLAIISRKNSRVFFEKELKDLQQQQQQQQADNLGQYNQFLTKSYNDISNQQIQQQLNTQTVSSLSFNIYQLIANLSNIQSPLSKINVNPLTQHIEIQGSRYLKGDSSIERKIIKNENLVMKNEILASKLSSIQSLKDKTNINRINIIKIIQKQNKQQQKRNQVQKQYETSNQNSKNLLQEKEQEENSKKYFELIQNKFLEIDTIQNEQNTQTSLNEEVKSNEQEQPNMTSNFLSLNSLKMNNQEKPLNIQSNNEFQGQQQRINSEDQLNSFCKIHTSNSQIYDCTQQNDQSLHSLQISYISKRNSFNDKSTQSQTPSTRTSLDHFKQFKSSGDNRSSQKFTQMLLINKKNVQDNIYQKFESYKYKQKNLLLEKFNFDTYRFKQIQQKIEQTQNRLFSNNLL